MTLRFVEQSAAGFTICWKCTQTVRLRADGKMARHRIPRAYSSQKSKLERCSESGRAPA